MIKVERFGSLEMAEEIDQQRIEIEPMPVARLASRIAGPRRQRPAIKNGSRIRRRSTPMRPMRLA